MLQFRESLLLSLVASVASRLARRLVKGEAAVLTGNHQVLGAVVTLGEDEPRLD